MSALMAYTTYLCVGQPFKDESLSTQRLYMHAFASRNTEPDVQDKSVRCYICIHISHSLILFLTHALVFEHTKEKKSYKGMRMKYG